MNYALLALYEAVLISIGVAAALHKGLPSFLIADRKAGAFRIGFSIAAGFFDGFLLVTYTGYVYKYGWPAMSLFVGMSMGFVLFFIFSARIRREGEEHGYYGMSDFFARRYGEKAALVVSVLNLVFYLSLLLIQVIFGSTVMQQITGWTYGTCVVIVGGMLLSYVALGGFRAVLSTDAFQWVLIMVIAAFFFPYFVRTGSIQSVITHADFKGALGDTIGFLLIGCMAIFSAPELWQRCFAAKDDRSIHGGLWLAGSLMPLVGIVLAAIGFVAYARFPGINPQDALVNVFGGMLPPSLKVVGLLLLLSAIMSTADTALFVIAPTLTLNVLKVRNQKHTKMATTFVILAALVFAIVTALLTRDVLAIAFSLASLSLALFPVLLGGLIWRLSSRTVIVSLLSGMVAVGGLIASGQITPTTSVVSLPVVMISLLVCAAWERRVGIRKLHDGNSAK